jgi:uncharacterized membrane protein
MSGPATPQEITMSSFSSTGERNLGGAERTISILGGALLALVALRRGPLTLALAALGGFLLYRGASARCPLYDALGLSSVGESQPDHVEHVEQLVDEAVEGTFPASDPPGFTAGSLFTQVSE